MRPLIVVHPIHGPGLLDALRAQPDLGIVAPADDDGVVEALHGSAPAGLVTFRWDDGFISPQLGWIQSLSVGVEQFPIDQLHQHGIVLMTARGAHTPAVAEHALALMLATDRGIGRAVRDAPERRWQPAAPSEISGRVLGVLGLGSIGEEIARKAKSLGMRVIGTKKHSSDYRGEADEVYGSDGTLALCAAADIVMVALPHDPDTAGLVGTAELAALGSGWIVNVGRGAVIDEDALVVSLTEGELRGAALDVTAIEPLPADSRLWDLPDVITTPHMAWSSDRLGDRLAGLTLANARAWLGSGDWVNRIG